MTNTLFSLADLALVITIVECVLTFFLVVIARAIPAPSKTCRLVLGALFMAIAFDALAMLLIWNSGLQSKLTNESLLPLLIASVALGGKGPLLYLFTRTLTQPNYALNKHHLWHLLPPLFGVVMVVFYQLNVRGMTVPVEASYGTPGASIWWWLMRVSPVVYAFVAIVRLRSMNALYDSHYTGNEFHYSYWIKFLIAGFLIQWGMALLTHVAGQYLPTGGADALGKVNDLLGVILVNGLLLYSFTLIRTLTPILGSDAANIEKRTSPAICQLCQKTIDATQPAPSISPLNHNSNRANCAGKEPDKSPTNTNECRNKNQSGKPEPSTKNASTLKNSNAGNHHKDSPALASTNTTIKTPPPINTNAEYDYRPKLQSIPTSPNDQRILEAINEGVSTQSLHLIHTLNIEKFARAINCPTKDVSRLINSHYDCSFSEFINAYRTIEAERLLKDPNHRDMQVIEVIHLAGFNSKSAFHRFFKRFTQYSPSEYRALHMAKAHLDQTEKAN